MKVIKYKCQKCNNDKQDELNIEGLIHHGCHVVCFDQKNCNRRVKKVKK